MTIVKTSCPDCGGQGTLPPLGSAGNPQDVKRFFSRPCDTCHCSRFVYIDKNIEETPKSGAKEDEGYIAGQGDCD